MISAIGARARRPRARATVGMGAQESGVCPGREKGGRCTDGHVLGIQHNDLIFFFLIRKWSPWLSSTTYHHTELLKYRLYSLHHTLCPHYFTSFIAGSLYLLISFTYFFCPRRFLQATTSSLYLLWVCLSFILNHYHP